MARARGRGWAGRDPRPQTRYCALAGLRLRALAGRAPRRPARRLGQRDLRAQARAAPGLALELEPAVERLHPVGEPAQAGALGRVRAADPVVRDLDDESAA